MIIGNNSSYRLIYLIDIVSKLDEIIILLDEYELTFAALRASAARDMVQAEIDGQA